MSATTPSPSPAPTPSPVVSAITTDAQRVLDFLALVTKVTGFLNPFVSAAAATLIGYAGQVETFVASIKQQALDAGASNADIAAALAELTTVYDLSYHAPSPAPSPTPVPSPVPVPVPVPTQPDPTTAVYASEALAQAAAVAYNALPGIVLTMGVAVHNDGSGYSLWPPQVLAPGMTIIWRP